MKHLFSILLALVAGVSLMHASTTQVDGIWYDFDDENHTAEVTANPNKYTGDVIIPASVEYDSVIYSVTSIDWKAFNNCTEMTSCVIPNSVTSFVASAFWGCNALQTINIPASVENIIRLDEGVGFLTHTTEGHGDDGFMISALTAINVDAQNPNYASIDGVLFNKELTTLIEYPSGRLGDYIVPNSVDSIGNYAFYGCHNISEITLPGTLRSIGMVAFGMSYVTDINMPEGLKYIGIGAVCACPNLHSISLPSTLEIIEESAFAASSNIDTIYNYATTPQAIDVSVFEGISKEQCLLLVPSQSLAAYQAANGWSQFTHIQGMDTATTPTCPVASGTCGDNLTWELGCDSVLVIRGMGTMDNYAVGNTPWNAQINNIVAVLVEDGVTSIGNYAFASFPKLREVTLPDGLLHIGEGAIGGNELLTSLVIPNSVQTIETDAFAFCWGMTSITLGSGITRMELALTGDENLRTIINYATTPLAIDSRMFYNVNTSLCILYVPAESVEAYQTAAVWTQFTTILPIEEEVQMYSWQVESNDIVMGIVSTTLNAGVYQYGTQITVEALPNSGYKFVKWNDGKKYNPYTFSLVDDKYLMAIFMAEEVEPDTVVVQPTETTVTITWPSVENSYTYSLIIYLDEECTIEYCTITFNENGQVIHINFAQQAPSRLRRQQNDFSYTIPGLSANTTYYYKIEAKDEDGKLLNTDEGSFQTEEDTSSAIEMTETTSTTPCKILVNGQVFILRADKTYTIDGQEVK